MIGLLLCVPALVSALVADLPGPVRPGPMETDAAGRQTTPVVEPPGVQPVGPAAAVEPESPAAAPLPQVSVPPPAYPEPPPASDLLAEPQARPPLDAVRAALSEASCLVAEVEDLGGRLLVTGTVAGEDNAAVARTGAERAAGGWEVGFELTVAGPRLCDVLTVLRTVTGASPPASGFTLTPGAETLRAGEALTLAVTAPSDRPVRIRLDYFTVDGAVVHLLPNPSDGDDRIEPGATRKLGGSGTGGRTWSIGAPFGHELLVALAAPAPLFAAPRPEVEPAAVYLDDLKKALDRSGGTVLTTVRLIVTAP